MKRTVCTVFCIILVFVLSLSAFAADYPLLTDEAGLLTVEQYSALDERLLQVSERLGWDIIVITLNGLDGRTPEKYADDFFDENGFKDSDTYNAALLLVSMEGRDVHVATSGECIDALDEDYILNVVISYLSEGDYAGAFDRFVDECEDPTVNDAYDYDGNGYYNGTTETAKQPFNVGSSGLLSALVGFITSLVSTGKMKSNLKSVSKKQTARGYVRKESFNLVDERDTFLYANIARVPIPRNENRTGGGGGHTHVSSGGHTYGGASGKF